MGMSEAVAAEAGAVEAGAVEAGAAHEADHDDRHARALADALADLEAVDVRHIDVEQHEFRLRVSAQRSPCWPGRLSVARMVC